MRKGYVYSIFAAILFGSAGLIIKFAFIEGIDAISLLTFQYVIAVVLMFGILVLTNKKALKVDKEELCNLAILGVIGNTFMTIFYYKAYEYLPMAMVTILLYTYPIMVFIYDLLFKREKIGARKVIALIAAFLGAVLVLGLVPGNLKYSRVGIMMGLLAAVFFAFMNVYTEEKLNHMQPLVINAYSTLFSLISLVIYKFPMFLFKGDITFNTIIYTSILAVVCEIIPLTLLYGAIQYIGAFKVSIIGNLEIPTAVILSFYILKDNISLSQIIGTLLVVYAVYNIKTAKN